SGPAAAVGGSSGGAAPVHCGRVPLSACDAPGVSARPAAFDTSRSTKDGGYAAAGPAEGADVTAPALAAGWDRCGRLDHPRRAGLLAGSLILTSAAPNPASPRSSRKLLTTNHLWWGGEAQLRF